MKTALSIAGSDSCAGAGIQADLKTMAMNGVYATTAITALTAQNTTGVAAILEVPPEFLAQQLDAVFADIPPDAVKTGMIPSAELMRVAAQKLAEYGARNVVIDPVMAASSGSGLMQSGALAALTDALFPLAALITPNIPEAQALSGKKIDTKAGMEDAARQIGERFGCAVLLKGGHLGADASDVLYETVPYAGLRARALPIPIPTARAARFPAPSRPIWRRASRWRMPWRGAGNTCAARSRPG